MATEARQITIGGLRPEHWPEVARIYGEGIATGDATFETSVPTWGDWDASHLTSHRLVAVDDGRVVGWAAVSPVSDRCVYDGVVENSVYIAGEARGQGVGRALLEELIRSTEEAGVWTIQTGIFPENTISVRVHERVGFGSSAAGNGSASSTACGATCSCSNGGARASSSGCTHRPP